jgi:ubiquinone/menaquinone biosynthesis C-methylase UbiE
MDIQNAYHLWSASYDTDRNLTRDLDQQVTANAFANWRFDSLLELGCGTGKNTPFYASIADTVYALDFTDGMIAKAKAKVQRENVKFAVADLARTWPVTDQSMSLAVFNLVLEHIADLTFVFNEARRVLAPHGTLFLSELHPFRQYGGAQATFQSDKDQIDIPAYVHHVSDFLNAAESAELGLVRLNEWWHDEDRGGLPRLLTVQFEAK